MFLRYFVDMPAAFETVEPMLAREPERWMAAPAGDAEERGESLMAAVGFRVAGRRLRKRVFVEFGPAVRLPTATVILMSWRATGPEGLFPRLEADVEIARLGPGRTQLAVNARYDPPLGAVGSAVDRVLLHRVAEATIKDFLDRVAEAVTTASEEATAQAR